MMIYPQLTEKKFMNAYRSRSMLIGKQVQLMQADHAADLELPTVTVVDIGDDAQLIVQLPDGSLKEVSSGEVSVKMQ